MTVYAAAPSTDRAAAARTAVAGLHTTLENHLAHAERDLEPFVVDHLDTPEFKATQKPVRRARKGNVGTFVSWLDDGAEPDTRASLRREMPAPVVAIVKTLAGRDYNRRIARVWPSA